jgi:hypothetical protein
MKKIDTTLDHPGTPRRFKPAAVAPALKTDFPASWVRNREAIDQREMGSSYGPTFSLRAMT